MNLPSQFYKYLGYLGVGTVVLLCWVFQSWDFPWKENLIAAFDFVSIVLLYFTLAELGRQREESERLNKFVEIVMKTENGRTYPLPGVLRRKEFSRDELMGRLGAVPMKSPKDRFSLEYTNSDGFHKEIRRILDSANDEVFVVECGFGEDEQFNIVWAEPETSNTEE